MVNKSTNNWGLSIESCEIIWLYIRILTLATLDLSFEAASKLHRWKLSIGKGTIGTPAHSPHSGPLWQSSRHRHIQFTKQVIWRCCRNGWISTIPLTSLRRYKQRDSRFNEYPSIPLTHLAGRWFRTHPIHSHSLSANHHNIKLRSCHGRKHQTRVTQIWTPWPLLQLEKSTN